TLLHWRRAHSELFLQGEYIPLRVTGARANHVIAFARRLHDQWCIVAVPRLVASLVRAGSPPIGEKVWLDTRIELPPGLPSHGKDVLTGRELSIDVISDLFAIVPFAVVAL